MDFPTQRFWRLQLALTATVLVVRHRFPATHWPPGSCPRACEIERWQWRRPEGRHPCEWNDQPWLCGIARTGFWLCTSAMTWLPPPSPDAGASEAMAWPKTDTWLVSDAIRSCFPPLSATADVGSATKLTPCGELEIEARRVVGRQQRREYTGRGIDLAERLQASDRRIVVVDVQLARMKGVDLVGRRICQRNYVPDAASDLITVVEAGVAAGDSRYIRKRHRLSRGAGVVDVDDRAVVTARQQQVAIRRDLQESHDRFAAPFRSSRSRCRGRWRRSSAPSWS